MVNKPDIQKRLQRVIDDTIGTRQPRLADKEKMPLVEAVSRGTRVGQGTLENQGPRIRAGWFGRPDPSSLKCYRECQSELWPFQFDCAKLSTPQ